MTPFDSDSEDDTDGDPKPHKKKGHHLRRRKCVSYSISF
jgi:hypothetical protein